MDASGGMIDPFIFRFAIFVLAIFVGYYVVWSVTPALHTPLMSVTNAISSRRSSSARCRGVEHLGEDGWRSKIFGFVALVLASVNIFGGFLVTQRMLAMYKKKDKVRGCPMLRTAAALSLPRRRVSSSSLALRGLSHPGRRPPGQRLGMIGMAIAVLVTTSIALATPWADSGGPPG